MSFVAPFTCRHFSYALASRVPVLLVVFFSTFVPWTHLFLL